MQGRDKLLAWGEPAPWFEAATPANPRFVFSSLAGRFVALVFLGEGQAPAAQAFVRALTEAGLPLRDDQAVRFAVVPERDGLQDPLLLQAFPSKRVFHDPGGRIAAAYGVPAGGCWLILDPMMRLYASGPLAQPESFLAGLRGLPPSAAHAGEAEPWAPVLLLPRVLEPALCQALIDAYRSGRPEQSGFMRTENGMTVGRIDPAFKRRSDVQLADERLRTAIRESIEQRLLPEIRKVFQFRATRIERYVVACYDAGTGGFFRAHRDNTTRGTAHRRFAVTVNLNAEEYEGGELNFPEFGPRLYTAPTGGAIVFSCSLLHQAMPVRRGTRFATLPFLYDDEGARIREANAAYLAESERAAE